MDPRCKVAIVLGKTAGSEDQPRHKQHSIVIVPMDTPGVKVVRPLTVFGKQPASSTPAFQGSR